LKRHEVTINHSRRIHVENGEELRKCITARVFLRINFHASLADHEDFLVCESEVFIDKRNLLYRTSMAAECERQENVLLHANVYTG